VAQTVCALFDVRRDPTTPRVAAGIALFLIAMIFWLWARAALGDAFAQLARVPGRLVTAGPYRLVRHPLYTATAVGCMGQAWAGGSLRGIAIWFALALILGFRARREDALMRQAFGSTWISWSSQARA